jgi:hypothetical protein
VGSVGRATTAARGAGHAARARENLAALQQKLVDLEREFEDSLEEVRSDVDDSAVECEELTIRPRKADLAIERVTLVWTPWRVDEDGVAEPDY